MLLDKLFEPCCVEQDYASDKTRNIRKDFEHYLFFAYDKACAVADVKNMYYDIKSRNKGFIREHEKIFMKGNFAVGNKNVHKDRSLLYFKRWTNTRLKRVKRILDLDAKPLQKNSEDIMHCLSEYIKMQCLGSGCNLEQICDITPALSEHLQTQKDYLDSIYPIENWTLEQHKELFDDSFMNALKEEFRLLFSPVLQADNYNLYPAIISRAMHKNEIPEKTCLGKLLRQRINKLHQNRPPKNIQTIDCYHARPIFVRGDLFPLDTRKKSTGFFVDTDPGEAKDIIQKIYQLENYEVDLYHIKMPENLFKRSKDDTQDGHIFPLENSYVFRVSDFRYINEFYVKGLISVG